jgi:hypothetical protein
MIHYHGTPMTPTAAMISAFTGRHAMVSFAHPWQIEIAAEVCQSIVLDNGAFSAWKSGEAYNFEGYLEWCLAWYRHPAVDWCVIPDVIDGDEAANDKLLETWPLAPEFSVPVWHLHESQERLARLMSYPRIALGSSGEFARVGTDRWWERIAEAMKTICDDQGRPKVKVHGLRMLDPGVFSKVPLASADSCNVARNVGIDSRWTGRYVPRSRATRALILMGRIEGHAPATRWCPEAISDYQNSQLMG